MRKAYIESFIILLFLSCCPFIVSSCHEEEKEEIPESPFDEEDIQHEQDLNAYLGKSYSCKISQVSVMESSVCVTGEYTGEGNFFLGEIPPYLDIIDVKKAPYKLKLEDSSFEIKLERYVERDGALYDRLLSKWAIYKEGVERDQLVSHAHQADEIHAFQNLPAIKLTSKKGLGGIIPNQYISDFTSLGISSATINVCITQFMHLTPRAGDIAHTYGGRTYYMDEGYLKTVLDVPLLEAAKRNIAVAPIILVEPAAKCVDPDLGALLQHPDYERGVYTMPNMTTLESVNCYAAAFDFLAKRYCTADNRYGRIAHWIMHNEVDGCIDWTNMGVKPLTVFTDTYIKSMRICYNIVRQYDKQAEVLGSFTHSWTQIANVGWWLYTSKEIIDLLKKIDFGCEYLISDNGKRLTAKQINYHLQKICKEIGIEPRSTHKLRRSYASMLLGAGVDTAVVTNQLGHTEIATTEKYYHYDIEDDAEKIQQINDTIAI